MLSLDSSLGEHKAAVEAACDVLRVRLPLAQRGKKRFPKSLYEKLTKILTQTPYNSGDPWLDKSDPNIPQYVVTIPPYAVIGYDPTTTAWAYTGGACIWLGDRPFKDRHPMRLPAVLLHELIHVACGGELDSETVENFMFRQDPMAATLTIEDLEAFVSCRFRGRWYRVVRESETAVEAVIKTSENIRVFTIVSEYADNRGLPARDQAFAHFLELIPVER